MGYKVTESAGTLHFDGKEYAPGKSVPIEDEVQIDALVACGAIEKDGKAAKADKADGDGKSPPPPAS